MTLVDSNKNRRMGRYYLIVVEWSAAWSSYCVRDRQEVAQSALFRLRALGRDTVESQHQPTTTTQSCRQLDKAAE